MNRIHTKDDGKKIYISQLTNEELIDVIKKHFKKIELNKKMLDTEVKINGFKSALYRFNKKSLQKHAIGMIDGIVSSLAFYILEAMLRNINMTKELQKVFERKEKEELFEINDITQFLTHNEYIEMDEE